MTQYLLSIYQPDGVVPPPEALAPVMRNVGALVEEDPAFQIGMFVGPTESLAFGVRKDDQRLLAALNEYITNVRRSATWNRLVVKYFGPSAVEILRRARTP